MSHRILELRCSRLTKECDSLFAEKAVLQRRFQELALRAPILRPQQATLTLKKKQSAPLEEPEKTPKSTLRRAYSMAGQMTFAKKEAELTERKATTLQRINEMRKLSDQLIPESAR
jgi:hypothetical protein